jgi:tetratricopeptide (TPR) repeat protein
MPRGDGTRLHFVREGREEHLDRLEEAYESARNGTPCVVLVAGDPGAGKTSLIAEVCQQARQRDRSAIIGWGECTGGATSMEPYLPFFQALNHLLGITVGSNPATVSVEADGPQHDAICMLLATAPALIGTFVDEPALVAYAQRLGSVNPSLQEQLHRILNIRNGADISGRFDQVVRFITSLTTLGPVILVLEDLHWASERAYALLLHLQRHLKDRHDVPLLIIGSYRQSDLARNEDSRRHPLEPVINEVSRQMDRTLVDLSTSIGADQGKAFVTSLVQQFPFSPDDEQNIATFLFDRTEGHPLFAVEMLRWLQDSGRLRQHPNGAWELMSTAMEGEVPGKIRAAISERIGRLPNHLRRILEIASVQGSVVSIDVLSQVAGIEPKEMGSLVDNQLVKRYRLLCERDATTINGQRIHLYQFPHSLFQEFLYDSLSGRERERLHIAIADATIALLGSTPHIGSGSVAFHFAHAHQYKEAAEHAVHAGAFAFQQLDYDLALAWYQRAEEYAAKVNDTWRQCDARIGQGISMRGCARIDEAIHLAHENLDDTRKHGFRDLEARNEDLLGQLYYDDGQFSTAAAYLQRSIAINLDIDRRAELSGTEAMLSHTIYRLGAYDEALLHAHRAWRTASDFGNEPFAAEALLAAGNCEVDLGMYETALGTYRRARTIYSRSGEVRGEILCDLNSGLCHLQLEDWRAAISILTGALETTEALRAPRLQATAGFYLGVAWEGMGDLEEAEAVLTQSLKFRQHLGQLGLTQDNIAALLRIATARGQQSTMCERLKELETWIRHHGDEGLEDPPHAYLSMAMAYCALGEQGASARAVRDGYELLMKRASRISDESARRSYLEHVPANRKLVEWHAHIAAATGDPPLPERDTPET